MSAKSRAILGCLILTAGLGADRGVERATDTARPPLIEPLSSIPMTLGDWIGRDEPIDPKILKESQATECLSRSYVNVHRPDCRVDLWMNYSDRGLNMRHSPEVCLPAGGWTKLESMSRIVPLSREDGTEMNAMLLGYESGELVQRIGFWYYIFGESRIERFVRTLPISSRSSHGRTTRGSGLTVEIFFGSDSSVDEEGVRDFATRLIAELEPKLPDDRAQYHIP
jgi:Protein of unknown function (DUF3485)